MQVVKLILLTALLAIFSYSQMPDNLKTVISDKLPALNNATFPIRYVRIEGVFQYLSKEDIKTTIEPLISQGFFRADVQSIQEAVLALPWVETADVERVWADAIIIKVTEKQPYIRWGQKSLMTEKGVIFTPKDIAPFQSLVLLNAPAQHQQKALEILKGISMSLSDKTMVLQEFTINNRWSWKIKLASGLEILLGRDEQLKKLQRFLKTLSLLGQDKINIMAIVDLRYPNGYAVSWKTDSIPIDWKAIATVH